MEVASTQSTCLALPLGEAENKLGQISPLCVHQNYNPGGKAKKALSVQFLMLTAGQPV